MYKNKKKGSSQCLSVVVDTFVLEHGVCFRQTMESTEVQQQSSRSERLLVPINPFYVSLLLPMWALKSPRKTTQSSVEIISCIPLRDTKMARCSKLLSSLQAKTTVKHLPPLKDERTRFSHPPILRGELNHSVVENGTCWGAHE